MRDFRKLRVWQVAHELCKACYRATSRFPTGERYGLALQIRKSSASIPANIAEGCGRQTPADLRRFLTMAAGSASELQYHLLLARDLDLLGVQEYEALLAQAHDAKRMLWGLIRRVSGSTAIG
ncbi:MAG: four helix bundle protein [Acidimicrobiia bacterium]